MTDSELSDEELWQSIMRHQESAFTQLMERHLAALLNYGRKFSTDKDMVQDCVQDVFADLWLRRNSTLPILSIRAYLFASVRNQVCRLARKDALLSSIDVEGVETFFSVTFSVEDNWIADEAERERLHQLNTLVNQLPPRQKEIIYLRYYQGLDNDQIVNVLGINYQSVSNLLQRTLLNLRNQVYVSLSALIWVYIGSK